MANEVQFLFCTISFRGFCETRQKVEELKAMREAYTNELQRLKVNFRFLFFCFVKHENCKFLSDVSIISSTMQMALMPSNRYRHRIHTGRSLAKNLEGVGSKN
jgi:hypothetical protein